MPKVQKHQYCPRAPLWEITTPRGVKLMCLMGDVKTIYYRKGKTWKRAGILCLHCLWFDPDHNFMPATTNRITILSLHKGVKAKDKLP